MPTANATYTLTQWTETPFSEAEGAGKLTRASVRKQYKGDLEGEGLLEMVMAYNTDGTAEYSGFERITGKLAGRQGSFVVKYEGQFSGGQARTKMTIQPQSATGELKGLKGQGQEANGHAAEFKITLEWSL